MNNSEILSHVDHTLLNATASLTQIQALCDEAIEYKTAAICVPPSYVRVCRDIYGGALNICTVVGFPLGYNTTSVKLAEIESAINDSANELDVVVNLGDVKNGMYDKITDEISALKRAADNKILKVIIETCYLNEDEKIALCHAVTNGGADYIKTSTGFGTSGASLNDILLFKKHIGSNVKIKAAGGIRTRDDMLAYLQAGCDRLGTSSAVKILTGGVAGGY